METLFIKDYSLEEIEIGLSKKKIIYTTLEDVEIPENKYQRDQELV